MSQKQHRLAITGGTGFVGRHVIKAALEAGHCINAIVRTPAAVSDFQHANLTWIKGGLGVADDELVADCDAVIHLAGLVKARTRTHYYDVNADAAGALAKAAQKAGVDRFVLISSMAASKPELSDYAGSKRAGERAVQTVFDKKIAIIRAPGVFGPGDKATAPFFDLLNKGLLPVPGGKNWRTRKISMTFAPDLATEILRAAITGCFDEKIVSPASLPQIRWVEFGKLCEKAFGRSIKVIPLPLSVLFPVAGVTSITSRTLGLGHLTLGKLAEFLHPDWSSETLISGATPPIEALKQTMAAYHGLKDYDA